MSGSIGAVWLAAIVFVGLHALSSTPLRGILVKRIGEGPYLGLFSVLAAASMFWLVWAYVAAPYEPVWPQLTWTRYLPLVVMPFAFVLVVCAFTTRSPTMVRGEGQADSPDPAPGILRITRHPFLWAIALWSASHIPAKGDVASLVLFGSLAALALLGMSLIDRKAETRLGAAWGPIALTTSVIPFLAAIQGRTPIDWGEIGWRRIGLGLGLYLVFLLIHEWLIGLSPWPV